MNVAVDEARKHGVATEVDDLRPLGRLAGAEGRDFVALYNKDGARVSVSLTSARASVSPDLDLEQEMDRPYAYVGRMVYGTEGDKGIDIIDLSDPRNAKRIYSWRIEDQDLHLGTGGMDAKHFKYKDRYYVVQSLQFRQGGPDNDLGAVVLDVTDLPDPTKVKEVRSHP